MRVVALLALLGAGCGVVFPLEELPVLEVRTTFTHSQPQTLHLTFDGDPALQPGDVAIAMIQGETIDDMKMSDMSPGWSLIADEEARGCNMIRFHVWFLRTIVTAETTFDFTFEADPDDAPGEPDAPDDFTAFVTAYANASDATLMDFQLTEGGLNGDQLAYAAENIEPGSIVWMGGGAQRPWADTDAPNGAERIGTFEHLAAFEIPAPGGQVPATTVPILDAFCADVAQIKVEPLPPP